MAWFGWFSYEKQSGFWSFGNKLAIDWFSLSCRKKIEGTVILINTIIAKHGKIALVYASMRVGNLKPNMEHIYVCLSLRDCSHKIYRFDAKREVSLLTLLLIPIFNLESTNVYVESIHSFQLTQRRHYKSYTIMSIMRTVCH